MWEYLTVDYYLDENMEYSVYICLKEEYGKRFLAEKESIKAVYNRTVVKKFCEPDMENHTVIVGEVVEPYQSLEDKITNYYSSNNQYIRTERPDGWYPVFYIMEGDCEDLEDGYTVFDLEEIEILEIEGEFILRAE